MAVPFENEQLRFLIEIAKQRTEFWDSFFRFLNYFDTPIFPLLLVPAVWIGYSYRWGLRIFYLVSAEFLTNGCLKLLIGWPRPTVDVPELGLYQLNSPGFPSGGAQTSFMLGALLIYYWRTPVAWTVGLVYIALIGFSRLYLGVHYPVDVLGGWFFGALFVILFVRFIAPIESRLKKWGLKTSCLLGVVAPLVLLGLSGEGKVAPLLVGASAIAIGAWVSFSYELYLEDAKTLLEFLYRATFGVLGAVAILVLGPFSQMWLISVLVLLWASLAASPAYVTTLGKRR